MAASRTSDTALETAGASYRSLVENAPFGVFRSTTDGRILSVNPAMVRILGYGTAADVLRLDLAHDIYADPAERAQLIAEHGDRDFEGVDVTWKRKDGRRILVRLSGRALRDATGRLLNYESFVEDITERRGDERMQRAVLQIAEAAHVTASLQELLRAVHRVVGELMPAKNLYIALYDAAEDLITFPYFVDEIEPPSTPRRPGRGLTEYVLRTGQPLLAKPEVYPELERRGEVEPMGAPSVDWLGVPLKSGDRTIGVIAAQTYTEGVRYTEREKVILQFVSTQIASAIERRRAEEALRESEERYRELVESSPDPIWVHAGGRTLYVNPACARLLGAEKPGDLIGRAIYDFVPPELHATVAARVERIVRQHEQSPPGELRLQRMDGSPVDVELIGIPLSYQGRPAVQTVMRDITARKDAEAQVRLLAQAVKSTRENISITDLQGRFTFVNRAFLEGYGYQESEVIGRSVALIDSPRNPPGLQQEIRAATAAGGWSGQLWNRRKDGSDLLISLGTSQVRDVEGRLIGLMGVWSDITEQAASERRYQDLVESAPLGIYQSTLEGRILTANSALARILGYDSVAELRQQRLQDVYVDPQERAALIARFEAVGRSADLELSWKKKDGTPIRIQLNAHTVRDAEGRTLYFEGFVRDVTEKARLEEQLRQAQKMEAIGQLAGGIAHDFNNLLTAILGFSSLVLRDREQPTTHRRDIEEIREAASRASALTQQLLAFGRKQVLQPVELDLNAVVHDIESMLRRLIGEHIEFVTVLTRGLPPVRADQSQLEQVIINLAVNARDAMPNGGKLTIETTTAGADGSAHPGVPPGRHVVLSVSDTGIGMDATTRARIFEPFFTTKSVGVGTGLGLATVYGIVQQSGGHIAVTSALGQGSTFRVYLPVVAPTAERATPRGTAAEPTGGHETVLIVEDEKAVRTLARQCLEQFGYRVLEAGDGSQALLLSQGYRDAVDLLLTDVVMPGMSGRELADRLTRARPGLKVLYTSGYTDSAIVHHGVLDPGVAYLPKPYAPDELARRVREVLDASGAGPTDPPATPAP